MNDVTTIDQQQAQIVPRVAGGITPMEMLDRAISSGAGIETLEKLLALQERFEANQARKAFDEAMAAAKADIPTIVKNRVVDFTSQKGRTNYRHEDLGEIAKTIDPILSKHGLSYRFRTTSNLNEPVTVTCIVSHRAGHSEENTLCAGRDDSGNKNSIQGVGSTISYLMRYTLKAAIGLAVSNDDDGRAAGADESGGYVTQDQAAQLNKLISETGTDMARFLGYMKCPSIDEMPKSQFKRAVDALEAKQRSNV